MKIGRLEINLEELANFIVKAKKNCYAGNGKDITLDDGSKRLTFEGRDFFYEDNYSGFYQAPGTEIVRWKSERCQRIWQMSYSGGMLREYWGNGKLAEKTFEFLKKALSSVSLNFPFRGKDNFYSDDYKDFYYRTWSEGSLFSGFKGGENIIYNGNPIGIIFSQDFIGGLVIPK